MTGSTKNHEQKKWTHPLFHIQTVFDFEMLVRSKGLGMSVFEEIITEYKHLLCFAVVANI